MIVLNVSLGLFHTNSLSLPGFQIDKTVPPEDLDGSGDDEDLSGSGSGFESKFLSTVVSFTSKTFYFFLNFIKMSKVEKYHFKLETNKYIYIYLYPPKSYSGILMQELL